jgi:hypothetical protein
MRRDQQDLHREVPISPAFISIPGSAESSSQMTKVDARGALGAFPLQSNPFPRADLVSKAGDPLNPGSGTSIAEEAIGASRRPV